MRLTILKPSKVEESIEVQADTITIGRASDNVIRLVDESVSKHHGRITVKRGSYSYLDLGSTNGTIVYHRGKALAVTGKQLRGQPVVAGDLLRVGKFKIRIEAEQSFLADDSPHSFQIVRSLPSEQRRDPSDLAMPDPRACERVVQFIQDARATVNDMERFLKVVESTLFELFPRASHAFLVLHEQETAGPNPVIRAKRGGGHSEVPMSRTILNRVLTEGAALMFSQVQLAEEAGASVVASGIESAICAPLHDRDRPFGIVQLDIRDHSGHEFENQDLVLLGVVADILGSQLETDRLLRRQRDGFLNAIDLVLEERDRHDPGSAEMRRRLRAIADAIGSQMNLDARQSELLHVAALLHDARSELLERLEFPSHLHEVPRVLSCRNEAPDGSGPQGLTGEGIPLASRILAVAGVVVKEPPGAAGENRYLGLISQMEPARDRTWDGRVLDALIRVAQSEAKRAA